MMKSNAQRTHELLNSTAAPKFDNPRHRLQLLETLREAEAAATSHEVRRRNAAPGLRWVLASAAGLVVAVALWTTLSLFSVRSVWAQALAGLEEIPCFTATTILFRDTESGTRSEEFATMAFRKGGRVSLRTASQRIWIAGGDMVRYDLTAGEVILIRGVGDPPMRMALSFAGLKASYGTERDLGTMRQGDDVLRRIEIVDESDPTEKVEFLAHDTTMLPAAIRTYRRDSDREAWRLAREDTFAYGVAVDDALFEPQYPSDAKVTEREAKPSERFANLASSGPSTAERCLDDAVAVDYAGDKYLAVEGVWRSPSGWFGVKFRTNLQSPFMIPVGFTKDPANQERWQADAFLLNNLAGGSMLAADDGTSYFAHNGSQRTDYRDGTAGYARYFLPEYGRFPIDAAPVEALTFRTLAVARDRGRGESFDHYWDWTEDTGAWHLFELTIPVPPPSETPPPCFTSEDLAWMEKTGVEGQARVSWLETMRRNGRSAEACRTILGQPVGIQRLYGVLGVLCLSENGKAQVAYDAFDDCSLKEKVGFGPAWMRVLAALRMQEEARRFRKDAIEHRDWIGWSDTDAALREIEKVWTSLEADAQGARSRD